MRAFWGPPRRRRRAWGRREAEVRASGHLKPLLLSALILLTSASCGAQRGLADEGPPGPILAPPTASSTAVSDTKEDARLSMAVRRGLVEDETLGFHARNVVLEVRGGKVVVAGQVGSERERKTVLFLTGRTPGVTAVADNMVVYR